MRNSNLSHNQLSMILPWATTRPFTQAFEKVKCTRIFSINGSDAKLLIFKSVITQNSSAVLYQTPVFSSW